MDEFKGVIIADRNVFSEDEEKHLAGMGFVTLHKTDPTKCIQVVLSPQARTPSIPVLRPGEFRGYIVFDFDAFDMGTQDDLAKLGFVLIPKRPGRVVEMLFP